MTLQNKTSPLFVILLMVLSSLFLCDNVGAVGRRRGLAVTDNPPAEVASPLEHDPEPPYKDSLEMEEPCSGPDLDPNTICWNYWWVMENYYRMDTPCESLEDHWQYCNRCEDPVDVLVDAMTDDEFCEELVGGNSRCVDACLEYQIYCCSFE